MSDSIKFKTVWHAAGIPGLVLACISTAYFLGSNALSTFQSGWAVGINTVLDLAKIVACIWLMKVFLTNFARENENAAKTDIRRLGTMIALLSALIFSACLMAYYLWHPELTGEVFDIVWQTVGDKIDANSTAVLEKMQEDFPRYIFFGNFIYCFLFGWILSSILAPRIMPDNPFAPKYPDEEENQ